MPFPHVIGVRYQAWLRIGLSELYAEIGWHNEILQVFRPLGMKYLFYFLYIIFANS